MTRSRVRALDRLTRRSRAVLAAVLVVLAVVGLVTSTFAIWARSVVRDEDRWVETVADLPRQDQIATALAAYLTEQVFVAVDLDERLERVLPTEVDVVVPVLTSALRGLITDQVTEFIQSDRFRDLWVTANREAHRLVTAILDDEDVLPGLERTDDQITLDLVPAINAVLTELEGVVGSIIGRDVALSEISDSDDTQETIRALGDRLGVDLPDDFGQIVVYQGDELPQPRDTIVLVERIRIATAIATVLLAALAIWVAPNRRRTLIAFLVGSAAGFAAVLLVPGALREAVGDLISDETNREAARAAVGIVFDSYVSLYRWLVATSLLSAITLYLTSDGRVARRVRAELRERADRFEVSRRFGAFVTRWAVVLRWGGVAVAVLLLLVLPRALTSLFVTLALLAAYESALSLARGPSRSKVRPQA